jgi:hypothetical protein
MGTGFCLPTWFMFIMEDFKKQYLTRKLITIAPMLEAANHKSASVPIAIFKFYCP